MDGEKLSLVDRNDQNTAPRTPEAPGSRPAREWRPEEQAARGGACGPVCVSDGTDSEQTDSDRTGSERTDADWTD